MKVRTILSLKGQLAEKNLKFFMEEEFQVGGHKLPKIWVLVADSRKALFFRKPDHHLEKIGEAYLAPESRLPKVPDIQSVINDNHNHKSKKGDLGSEEQEFIKALAKYLNDVAKTGAFDRLVIAMTPKTLGMLRELLSKEVQIRITAELDKNLTHLDEKTLYDYLVKVLWV